MGFLSLIKIILTVSRKGCCLLEACSFLKENNGGEIQGQEEVEGVLGGVEGEKTSQDILFRRRNNKKCELKNVELMVEKQNITEEEMLPKYQQTQEKTESYAATSSGL